jgi:hypothetical protein
MSERELQAALRRALDAEATLAKSEKARAEMVLEVKDAAENMRFAYELMDRLVAKNAKLQADMVTMNEYVNQTNELSAEVMSNLTARLNRITDGHVELTARTLRVNELEASLGRDVAMEIYAWMATQGVLRGHLEREDLTSMLKTLSWVWDEMREHNRKAMTLASVVAQSDDMNEARELAGLVIAGYASPQALS